MSDEDIKREFFEHRDKLNEIVMKYAGLEMKKFFSLDNRVYRDGALPARFKELLGLCASIVLRCEDCIKYHTIRCEQENVSDAEFEETLSVALIVGGSITIPHIRKCLKLWDEMKVKNERI
ncbi:carboxymuconolactone decarboxylase family protein [bacterium]|nr:MAG: carboxymuconolactone decarboxylase family protein [bacterium]